MIRQATEADREALHELYRAFFEERLAPDYWGDDLDEELGEVDEIIGEGFAFVADEDGLEGFALGRRKQGTRGVLTDLYVRPESRRKGIATELARTVADALAATGAIHMTLNVTADNAQARAAYAAWGFREYMLTMAVEIERLQRLDEDEDGASYGSVHVQTDDAEAVVKAVKQFVPRLPGHSAGTVVTPTRGGWVAVYDELCDREPPLLQRLAKELTDRMGAVVLAIGVEHGEVVRFNLYEHGRSVDEYVSVPEYYGPIAPGDVVALGANPTVIARLTGADRERIRAVARTASSPAGLPPADELLAAIAVEMKLEGATFGYAEAVKLPEAIRC